MPVSLRPARRLLAPLGALTALALALAANGCAAFSDDTAAGTTAGTTSGGGMSAVAAFYPLQYATQRVAGDLLEVGNLTQPGGEPHDLELAPRQTAEIAEADLVVYLDGFQAAVDDSVGQNATGETLDAAEVVELREADAEDHSHEGEDHSHEDEDHSHDGEDHSHEDEEHSHDGETSAESHDDGHDHDHGDTDPHFWTDPSRMAQLGDTIAERLGALDPDNAETYTTNAAQLREDLEELDTAYAETLASCQRSTVVVSHDAFAYLDRYGLEFESINGLSPGAEPTPADLARLQDLITDDGITTVFSERLVSPRIAESLARDAGVQTAVLDPIEGLSDETADQDYLSLMRANLDALAQANGCT